MATSSCTTNTAAWSLHVYQHTPSSVTNAASHAALVFTLLSHGNTILKYQWYRHNTAAATTPAAVIRQYYTPRAAHCRHAAITPIRREYLRRLRHRHYHAITPPNVRQCVRKIYRAATV